MIVFDDMNASMEEFEPYTKGRKSKIRRLDKDNDRSFWKRNELIFDRLYLRISELLLVLSFWRRKNLFLFFALESSIQSCLHLKNLMVIEPDSLIFLDIMWSDNSILFFCMRILRIDHPTAIERLWGIMEFSGYNV